MTGLNKFDRENHRIENSVFVWRMRSAMFSILLTLIPVLVCSAQKGGEPGTLDRASSPRDDQGIEFFESYIRPILVEHCLECHGSDEKKVRGGLRLTSRESMLLGGDSGTAVVPGKPNESLFISSVHYEDYEMPPEGQLSESQIASLVRWVEMGAPDPRRDDDDDSPIATSIDIESGKSFWAFQPRKHAAPPVTIDQAWAKTPIDQFILTKLEANNIAPVGDADRRTLVRRAYIDLIGLPPTPEQIDAFLDDPNPTDVAFLTVIDRLLDSRQFGERWGRHWLDVVRFAESSGGGRSLMLPAAWRFRDFVIQSYNDDKPFDLFLKQQLAGDLMTAESHSQKIEQIVAAGMLVIGPVNLDQQDKELLQMEVVDEQVDAVGRAFLGMTLGCARCHDHKFDPIPTRDYYAIAGIFGATQSLVDGNVSSHVKRPLATEKELAAEAVYRATVKTMTQALAKLKSEAGGKLTDKSPESSGPKSVPADQLPGIVLDSQAATLRGRWLKSKYSGLFVGESYLHDDNANKGDNQVVFSPEFESSGWYEVRMSYTTGPTRATNVPVTVSHQDGQAEVVVNQSVEPPIDGVFVSLGRFRFEANAFASVTIETRGTDGHVIVDAIQFLEVESGDANGDKRNLNERNRNERGVKPGSVSDSNEDSNAAAIRDTESGSALKSVSDPLLERIQKLEHKLQEVKNHRPPAVAFAMSVTDVSEPVDGHLHIRGSIRNLGPVVPRGLLSVCCEDSPALELSKNESGRLQLAEWMASPDHPLTARVYVNRVWRNLFGAGLVTTTDNFGLRGTRPSHPLLLDYLANQFVADDWSTKTLIRQIMLSRVYQLAAAGDQNASSIDPSNRLLWKSNRRRVDAEVLRDSILFVSGDLDLSYGGATIRNVSEYDRDYQFDSVRRSVYVPAFRNSRLAMLEIFDMANPSMVVGNRTTSTLPTQALFLMNSPMVMDQATKAAARLLQKGELGDRERVIFAWRQTTGRKPGPRELQAAIDYIRSFGGEGDADVELKAWTSFYHSLFASLEFRYVD